MYIELGRLLVGVCFANKSLYFYTIKEDFPEMSNGLH